MKDTNDALARELTRLANVHGGLLHPRDVVAAARDEDSPLHEQFDWDDSEAAERWRIHQARQLMVRVQVTYADKITHDVLVSVTTDRKSGGYRLVSAVMADDELRQQMLADAKTEMRRFSVKYKHLTELAEIFAVMDEVIDRPAVAQAATA